MNVVFFVNGRFWFFSYVVLSIICLVRLIFIVMLVSLNWMVWNDEIGLLNCLCFFVYDRDVFNVFWVILIVSVVIEICLLFNVYKNCLNFFLGLLSRLLVGILIFFSISLVVFDFFIFILLYGFVIVNFGVFVGIMRVEMIGFLVEFFFVMVVIMIVWV